MRPSRLPTGSTPRQISSPAEKRTSRSPGRSGWIRAVRTSRSSALAPTLLRCEPLQRLPDHCDADPPAAREVFGPERAVGTRPARDEVAERVLHRLEKLPRKPGRRRDAERVADAGRVLRRDPSLLA